MPAFRRTRQRLALSGIHCAPLNAAKFNADEVFARAARKAQANFASRIATTGRLEYVGIRASRPVPASLWGFRLRIPPRFDVPVKLFDLDARYSRDRLELRGAVAYISIQNAGELNDSAFRLSGIRTGQWDLRATIWKPGTGFSPAAA